MTRWGGMTMRSKVLKELLDSTAAPGWEVLGRGAVEPGDLPGSAGDHLRRAEQDRRTR